MTRPSSGHRLRVFDFGEEDEQVEKASEKLVGRFGNPKRKRDWFSPSISKYAFLQQFAGCTGIHESRSVNEPIVIDDGPINVDLEVAGEMKTECEEICDKLVDMKANGATHSHQSSVSSPMCMLQDVLANDTFSLEASVQPSSSNNGNQPSVVISDDDGRSEMGSSFAFTSTNEENEVLPTDPVPECCLVGQKVESLDDAVIVSADFILYENTYCTESHIIFSRSCIRIEGFAVNGSEGTFNAEWAIGHIINIESEWCEGVDTAIVNLVLKSKVSEGIGNENETSGIDMLKFSVCDPYWSERQEAIKSLDIRYRDTWNVISDFDRVKDGSAFAGSNEMTMPKCYLFALDETFNEVIYPKGDPDAVAISKRDVDLLQPETFINDTIVDFYVKFLKNKIQPEDQHRFHFFNSFFFRKLADLDKDPSSACEGRAAFERVRKWTRKVNLFEKDFIFIPVNYGLHWSLIVICHPGEAVHFRDEESEGAHKVPCILHMDSIRGSHRGLKNLIQSYLCEEWKERHNETLSDVSSKFLCLRFVPLELPQQQNSYDCGLFLLHYLELFLEEVPMEFNPFKITQCSSFLSRNWFPPEEASLKRGYIKRLICEIVEDHSQEVPQLESIDRCPHSQLAGHTDERETGVELSEEKYSMKMCQGNSSVPIAEHGTVHVLPLASPLRVVQQQIKEPEWASRESFEQGTSRRPFALVNYTQVGISPIEEEEESGEQIPDSSSDSDDCCQITELGTEYPMSYLGKDFGSYKTYGKWKNPQVEEIDDDGSSSGSSISESQKSSEIGADDDDPDGEYKEFVCAKETERLESSSTSTADFTGCIVEDSQEASSIHSGNDPSPSDGTNNFVGKDNEPMSKDNLGSESAVEVSKRPKMMSPEGGRCSDICWKL